MFFWFMKSIEKVDAPTEKLEYIENKDLKDSLKEENKVLLKEIRLLREQADSLEQKLEEKKQTIIVVRRNRDEEIARIDHLDSHELYRFFAGFNPKSRDQ